MNTQSVRKLTSLIGITILLGMACRTTTPTPKATIVFTQTTSPRILHFENEIVAFDYAQGSIIFNTGDPAFVPYPGKALGGELVAGMADPRDISADTLFRSIGIFRRWLPAGTNSDEIIQKAYVQAGKISFKRGY